MDNASHTAPLSDFRRDWTLTFILEAAAKMEMVGRVPVAAEAAAAAVGNGPKFDEAAVFVKGNYLSKKTGGDVS